MKKGFLTELHCHTSDNSSCAHWEPEELVDYYARAGFDCVVITNHYCCGTFDGSFRILPEWSWKQKVEHYIGSIRRGKSRAERYGMQVLCGMEIRFSHHWEELLVYGWQGDFLIANPLLWEMSFEEFRALADQEKLFIAQSHPFRPPSVPLHPVYMHGAEVYNAHMAEVNDNEKAKEYAKTNGLIMIAGSDAHDASDGAKAGVWLPERPQDEKHLAEMLFKRPEIYIKGID
jgi:predicted metal-dependent phosphoesterase TrpH